ncbi:MAG: DUF2723 domain-containing protein [Bacteroidota bacterium]|nr:DUF2723 domain-containing protein [Bacteroidota bacterium]
MEKFRKYNRLTGWIVFCISTFVYILTLEPTVSWWDCGEFIPSAYKLEVCHPPGAPLYLLLGRFFSLFAFSKAQVALAVNLLSALASSFTVLFLFWTITHISRRIICAKDGQITPSRIIAIIGAGVVGSLAFAFSDTFWFSAVEAEVYALSSFFTAITFWAVLRWEEEAGKPYANRWIVLIALLTGLSVGVHLLNILIIPAIVLVYYFRLYKTSPGGLLKAILLGCLFLLITMYLIIPGVPRLASVIEFFCVNSLRLPFNSGLWFFLILMTLLFAVLIFVTIKYKRPVENLIVTALAVFMIGFSSYAVIMIRANANPPINEDNPNTLFNLVNYLNREQYGESPLFYGPYYSAPLLYYRQHKPLYQKEGTIYAECGRHPVGKVYDDHFCTLFPRMYSPVPAHIKAYKEWGKVKGEMVNFVREDEKKSILKPTFKENLRFFFSYQVNFMYFRYLMWNYSGRQNDIQGAGNVFEGNWITGIDRIDALRLGPQDKLPQYLKQHPARNRYYMIPFILGLLGIIALCRSGAVGKRYLGVTIVLFLMTGLAVAVYLNQTPLQPRERDYAYVGSFYAFAIWIGLGVIFFVQVLNRWFKSHWVPVAISSICLLAVPGLMASENYDDHNRSHRYMARDYALNYLESCAPNAILFTYGDNDTFPLWYLQEVEGIRTDVRVCNLSLLSADWYINQLRRSYNNSPAFKLGLNAEKYRTGKRELIYVSDFTDKILDLDTALNYVNSDSPSKMISFDHGADMNFIPSQLLSLKVDRQKVVRNEIVEHCMLDQVPNEIVLCFPNDQIKKSDLAVLDILQHNIWDRPVYFDESAIQTLGFNMEDYLQLDGFAYRLVPLHDLSRHTGLGGINTKLLYGNLMTKFRWGNVNRKDVFLDDTNLKEIEIIGAVKTFCRLGKKLTDEGMHAKALSVLDRAASLFVNSQVPHDYSRVQLADAYFYCGCPEKGIALIRSVSKSCFEKLDYMISLPESFSDRVESAKEDQLAILHSMLRISERYNQIPVLHELEGMLMKLSSLDQQKMHLSKKKRHKS